MRKSSKLFDKKLNLSHKKYEEICKLMENQKIMETKMFENR
jgi:hypothetical protein